MFIRARGAAFHLFGLGLALLSAGCGAAFSGAFTPPEQGGAPWIELSSPHFLMSSDLGADEARETLGELEQMHEALADLGFPYEAKPRERMRVIVFRRADEYQEIAPRGSAGYFMPRRWFGGDGPEPAAVLFGVLTPRTRQTMQHELTHRFVSFYYPKVPLWLNEGLAEYFETMIVEDGHAILGRPSFAFREGTTWYLNLIPTAEVPRLRQIIELGPDAMSAAAEEPGSNEGRRDEMRRVIANRAGAWAFVRLFMNGPQHHRDQFQDILKRIGEGKTFEEAWADAYSAADVEQLEGELAASLVPDSGEVTVLRTPYTPRPARIERERTMSPAEVHLLWAILRPRQREAEIQAALQFDPGSPRAQAMQARLLMSEGQLEEAERLLRSALSSNPDDRRVLLTLFELYAARSDFKDADPRWRARAEELLPRLLPLATSSAMQNTLAWSLGLWGRTDEAMPLSLRSVEKDPSCWECYDTLGMLLAQKGALEKAIEVQLFALNLMPENVYVPSVYNRLRKYRADAKKARAQAEASGAPPPEATASAPAAAPGLSDSVVRTIVQRSRAVYDRCYAAGLSRDAKLSGKVIVRFVVEKDGAVSGAKDDGSTLQDQAVIACVLGEVQKLRFPAREGGAAAEVVYPISFNPPDPAQKGAGPGKK